MTHLWGGIVYFAFFDRIGCTQLSLWLVFLALGKSRGIFLRDGPGPKGPNES